LGRPGCEQCCGKPEPAQCLSCLHACEYAEVNDPDLLEKYWNERVYQPNVSYSDFGYSGEQQDFQNNSQASPWGFNVTRTYPRFDPTIHPCNEDKFEYVVFVLNCQLNTEIPNGDYDICINGENLGTYYGSDMINPQDIPTFEGLPLFPFDSKHNESQACGPALYKHTIFGTSQEAIDQAIDTNFGHGWLTSGGIGQPSELIPPEERRTLADFNTYVVPKDSFLMDARDIVIDQSGNPSFGPRSGSFNIKFIPNPGINNLRLDLRVDGNGTEATMRAWEYSLACAVPQGILDADDARGGQDGVHHYPVQWTPPSKIQVIIYSLERGVTNDNLVTGGFRFCTVANGCFCAPKEEEVCDNFGFRPLCVNPFDSDNYEDGEAKFISAADYDASTECTCDDEEEYEEPESPGEQNAAPTCYYEADIFTDQYLGHTCFVITTATDVPADDQGDNESSCLCNCPDLGPYEDFSPGGFQTRQCCPWLDTLNLYIDAHGNGWEFAPLGAANMTPAEIEAGGGIYLGNTRHCSGTPVENEEPAAGNEFNQTFSGVGGTGCVLHVGFDASIPVDGDWKGKTRQIIQAAVDNAQDGPRFPDGGEPVNPGYAVRIMKALQAKAEEALALTNGCPARITAKGYVGPFAFSPSLALTGGVQARGTIYGSKDGMFGNLNDVYLLFDLTLNYGAKALSDAIASDITNSDGQLEFDGTCCAKWRDESDLFSVAPATLRNAGGVVRDKNAGFIALAQTTTGTDIKSKNERVKWSTNLGRLLHMNPGVGTYSSGFNLYPCDEALVNGVDGDSIPLYMDLANPLAATAPFPDPPADPNQDMLGFGPTTSDSPLGVHEITREGGYFDFGGGGFDSVPRDRVEEIRIFPFLGELNDEQIVYTLNDLSTGQYYFNVDSECAGMGCTKPEQPEGEDPCLPCGNCIPLAHEIPNFLCISSVTECPPDPRDPCQPFAADPDNCAEITNGVKEYHLDDDGNVYCGILCNTGYVLEYDDVTGCAQCVQVQCQGSCNFSWTGNSWNFFPIGSTCPCKCEPPNIPGTFVGEIGQGTCVDDIANRICGEGKCWWTWFNLVGGGGEWRKNGTDDPFGISTDCECRCDPPNRDGFAGEQLPTGCYE